MNFLCSCTKLVDSKCTYQWFVHFYTRIHKSDVPTFTYYNVYMYGFILYESTAMSLTSLWWYSLKLCTYQYLLQCLLVCFILYQFTTLSLTSPGWYALKLCTYQYLLQCLLVWLHSIWVHYNELELNLTLVVFFRVHAGKGPSQLVKSGPVKVVLVGFSLNIGGRRHGQEQHDSEFHDGLCNVLRRLGHYKMSFY